MGQAALPLGKSQAAPVKGEMGDEKSPGTRVCLAGGGGVCFRSEHVRKGSLSQKAKPEPGRAGAAPSSGDHGL